MGKAKKERFDGLPEKVISSPRRVLKTITVEIECEDEHEPIEGNCLASGDDEADRNQAKWIEHQLALGNPWAWCGIKVTATMDGTQGHDYLGCCSYLSGADFVKPQDGYITDMITRAVEDLLTNWDATAEKK